MTDKKVKTTLADIVVIANEPKWKVNKLWVDKRLDD